MANLRTNNLSGEQGQNAYRGSLYFNGIESADFLTLASSSDFDFSTGDVTVEAWVFMSSHPSHSHIFSTQNFDLKVSNGSIRLFTTSGETDSSRTVTLGQWHHIAAVRASSINSGNWVVYLNGIGVNYSLGSVTSGASVGEVSGRVRSSDEEFHGFISNLRVVNGTAVYTSDFTPPTSELTLIPNTVLLCCQDTDNPLQEATGKTITGFGRYADSSIELVTNPSFNNGTTGWTLSDANEGSMAVVNGSLVLTNDDSSDPPVYAWQAVTLVVGQRYVLKVHFSGGTGTPGSNLAVYLNTSSSFGSSAGGFMTADTVSGNGVKTMEFTASAATTYVLVRVNANASGTSIFSTVSIKAADQGILQKFIPPFGVDAGNAFGGPIQQSTQGYMYFPTGRTEERGGSRGVCAGGSDPSGRDNDISFIDIQSQGNAQDFGDLSLNSHNTAGFSSKTRAIFSLGYIDASPNVSNTLEFITMMTQGNATDFGDVSFTVYESGAASNDTRGLIAGGYNASPLNNVTNIDFVTIASLGNGSDFGDLTLGRRGVQGCGSPTRSVFASGYQQPDTGTKTNVIDFVTIATAGNAQDFGDLTSQRWGTAACADSTKGVFFGGLTPSSLNVIDFITIATTGNATDFGDLTDQSSGRGSSTSNSIRGVYFHGIGSYVNTIGFVVIQTTGNEVDFGDNTYKSHGQGSGSTAHGGLS